MQNQITQTCCHQKRCIRFIILCCLFLVGSPCFASEPEVSADPTELKSIASINTDITPPKGDLPTDATTEPTEDEIIYHVWGTSRPWLETNYFWEASHLRHQPLYFEEVNAERHGYYFRYVQPIVSAGRFFGTVPILPYKMGVHSPDEMQYSLGHYRMGNAVPLKHNRIPLSIRGAAYQAAATVGAIYIIP